MTSTVDFLNIRNISHAMISDLYAKYIDYDTDTFTNPLIREVENLYNKIVSEILSITDDQETFLDMFSKSLMMCKR